MQQSNSQEWRLAGGRLAAQVWGPDTASTTWLALHGWADNAATFARLAPDLTDTLNLRIVALDFSGHGHSAHRPPRSEYALWSYSHDALDALDALGLTRVTLLGHSLGAGVANLLAATYPERVQALVLIDGLLGRLATTAGLVGQLRRGSPTSGGRRPSRPATGASNKRFRSGSAKACSPSMPTPLARSCFVTWTAVTEPAIGSGSTARSWPPGPWPSPRPRRSPCWPPYAVRRCCFRGVTALSRNGTPAGSAGPRFRD